MLEKKFIGLRVCHSCEGWQKVSLLFLLVDMEIKVNRLDFLDALIIGGSMAGRSKVVEILDCAKCTIKSGRMVVSSFDNETAVMRHFPIVPSDAEVSFCINPRDLSNVLKSIGDEVVTLNLDDSLCRLEHSCGVIELPVLPAEDFPTMKKEEDTLNFKIDRCQEFVGFLRNAKEFVGNDKLRPILNGVYVFLKNGQFGVASSNALVLYKNYMECEMTDIDCEFVISTRAMTNLIDVLSSEQTFNVSVGKTNVVFTTSNSKISCREIEGKYPNIDFIIPKEDSVEVKFLKSDLVAAVGRAILSANEGSCQLSLEIKDGNMSIDSQNLTMNKKTHEECSCELVGGNFSIGVNGKFLSTCLNAIDSEYVKLGMTEKNRPISVHDLDNENQRVILMPIVVPKKR